ncbi:hypothetical protein FRB90_009404 [Tulasnella sp. 427]|nr:hypothetical protein FRB90_009404 [Tulasnella sp. 427]
MRAPYGSIIVPIILASDKTTLTSHTGGKNAHPLYLTLGNIRKDARAAINQRAYMLLAYIPILGPVKIKFPSKSMRDRLPGIMSKRLYHKSLKKVLEPLQHQQAETPLMTVDPEGYMRMTWRLLMGWIADMEETFVNAAKKVGLGGVEEPCWEWMSELPWCVDIVKAMSHDLLHWYHKAFRDYIVLWNQNIIDVKNEPSEIDLRLRLQIPQPGFRHFTYGISNISQWTQGDTRDLEKDFLAALAGAPRATGPLLTANRAYLDYLYLACYPYHTEKTLKEADQRVKDFEDARDVYAWLGGRVSKETGAVIKGFQIPKLHIPRHLSDYVRWKGTLDGSTTETSERLHIDLVKEAWRATNHRGTHLLQMLCWLDLHERVTALEAYIDWRDRAEAAKMAARAVAAEEDKEVMVRKQTTTRRAWQVPNPVKDNVVFKLTKRPHLPTKSLDEVIIAYNFPHFIQDLQEYFTQRELPGIPQCFSALDIWSHVHVLLPILNDFMKAEWRKIQANGHKNTYDPVLFNDSNADVVGLIGYSVGELHLIFRPSNPQPNLPHPFPEFLAYVYMFSPIQSSQKDLATQFFKVSKDYLGSIRRGKIIELDSIICPCPLAPIINEAAEIVDDREGTATLLNNICFSR